MTTKTPPAIFFHADAVEGKGKDLVGRRSVGQSFLKGYLAHAGGDQVAVGQNVTSPWFVFIRNRQLCG